MENNICNSMILTSRRRHFYLVGQSKHKVGACGVKTRPLQFWQPDGHGYELLSSNRALVPQKFSVEEELMHVKHVEFKSPHVGVCGSLEGELSAQVSSSSLTAVQNYVVARQ
ncbi:hypothetical protein TNCV_2814341 [Trichonephila clavipes]|nr:hypothetical protein TNCV_2814341 [Trichonephila clavipes]